MIENIITITIMSITILMIIANIITMKNYLNGKDK